MRLVRSYKLILFMAVFLMVIGLLVRCHMREVPVVLVGPIEPSMDAVGPINKGMTRRQVIDILGTPLRPRSPKGSPWTDYFSGIYADVGWTSGDKVASVGFSFAEFNRTYNADFRVVLRLSNRDVVLSRRLSWLDAQHLWKNAKSAPPSPRIINGDHVINLVYSEEEYIHLDFSTADGKLNYVVYVFEDQGGSVTTESQPDGGEPPERVRHAKKSPADTGLGFILLPLRNDHYKQKGESPLKQ